MAFEPLDGPSVQGVLSLVGTATPIEVKSGASAYEERKVVTLQSDGKFYLFFGEDGVTPSAATVAAQGFTVFKDQLQTVEASCKQPLYVLSTSGTIDVRIAERA